MRRAGARPAALLLLASILAPGARATAPARDYDRPGVGKGDVQSCVVPRGASFVLRDVEGRPLRTESGTRVEESGCVSVERLESVSSNGLRLFYTWAPEHGFLAQDEIAQGELALGDRRLLNPAGAGDEAPALDPQPRYRVRPEDMWGPGGSPQLLCYPAVSGANVEARSLCKPDYTYAPYGRALGGAAFALLTWSWVDVAGGGIARATVAEGSYFYPADVEAIATFTVDSSGALNGGEVWARYGYVLHDDEGAPQRLYGWLLTKHTYGAVCYDHLEYAGGGPPLEDALCPAAPKFVASAGEGTEPQLRAVMETGGLLDDPWDRAG